MRMLYRLRELMDYTEPCYSERTFGGRNNSSAECLLRAVEDGKLNDLAAFMPEPPK